MIRRNHIDNGCKIDRNDFRSRQRSTVERPSVTRMPQRTPCDVSLDENIRLTSNNKKYHQYKEQRENRSRPIQEFKEQSKSFIPFTQVNTNHKNISEDRILKREYAYDFEDTLKIDYGSISLKPPRQRSSLIGQTKVESSENVVLAAKDNNSNYSHYKLSNDQNQPASSPPKGRKNVQSLQKEHKFSNIKGFTPLFEETAIEFKKESDQLFKREFEQELGHFYEPGVSKVMKTHNQNRREELSRNIDSRKNIVSDYSISKYVSNLSTNSQAHSSINSRPAEVDKLTTDTGRSVDWAGPPTLPASYHREQVSQKLKMISDFNDQINQRIKNIIGCFEGLKNKL